MSQIAVRIHRVSKRFKLHRDPVSGPVFELLRFWKRGHECPEFRAVDDLSLEVARGEVVGIVGPNGAGKTTLLKMVAGLLPVDEGRIEVHGRVTALLALGVGVHPEFTGRENIVYSGMLLGMSRREVLRKMDEIIDFSGIEDYVDRPFRMYSAGMRSRLLFSVFSAVAPEILIVDEALATGDAQFIGKCKKRIREICRSGATVLFVSHNMSQVQALCERAILMAGGRLIAEGSPSEIQRRYSDFVFSSAGESLAREAPLELRPVGGTGEVTVSRIALLDRGGCESRSIQTGEPLRIRLDCARHRSDVERVHVFVGLLRAADGEFVGEVQSWSTVHAGRQADRRPLCAADDFRLTIDLDPLLLVNNHYSLWIMLLPPDRSRTYCEYKGVQPFFVGKPGECLYYDVAFHHPADFGSEPADAAIHEPQTPGRGLAA